jgi:membrane-bound lytic murein transglycosylase D
MRKIRTAPPFGVACLALTLSLLACSSPAKSARTTPKTPASKTTTAAPPDEGKAPPVPPAQLPVVGAEDLNGYAQDKAEKNGEADKEAGALLEEGFAAYQEALAAIDRGDMEAALVKLDEAYAVIPKVKLPLDSPLLQEKNDLRVLVAQRIQQVYASSPATAPRPPGVTSINNAVPMVENQWVAKELASFQGPEKAWFLEAYKRSGLYREMILSEVRKGGLPEQLSWLPMIESWFKVRALSRARALGMWQFIASTGYRYGLKRDKYVDQRMDPAKSTRAALQHLGDLHALFGDWLTALAAYNCGEAYVQKVIRGQRIDYLDNFWDLFNNLPWETARYVPRFIASLKIIEDPAKYGFELPAPDAPLKFETIRIATPVKLAALAQSLDIDAVLLTILNPELRFDSTPNYEYDLRVPEGYGERCLACVATLPQYVPPDIVTDRYRVQKGDTLGAIARKYRTSVDAIVRANNLTSRTMIREGQVLRIPVSGLPANTGPPAGVKAGDTVTYVVKAGDTLSSLSRMFSTTVEKIKAANNLVSDELVVGQKLTITVGR